MQLSNAILVLAALIVTVSCKPRQDPGSETKSDLWQSGNEVVLSPIPNYPPVNGLWQATSCVKSQAQENSSYLYKDFYEEQGFYYSVTYMFLDDQCKKLGAISYNKHSLAFHVAKATEAAVQALTSTFMIAEQQLLEKVRVTPVKPNAGNSSSEFSCASQSDILAKLQIQVPNAWHCYANVLSEPKSKLSEIEIWQRDNPLFFSLWVDNNVLYRDHLDAKSAAHDPNTKSGCVPNLGRKDFTSWLGANLRKTVELQAAGQKLPNGGWCTVMRKR